MALSRVPSTALDQAMRLLGGVAPEETAIRQAAWIARCVGRGEAAPLTPDALTALAATLTQRRLERGTVVFPSGQAVSAVWIRPTRSRRTVGRLGTTPQRGAHPATG